MSTSEHENENDNNDRELEITEADFKDFKAFQAQQQAKKSRAQKKRITKAGNPDKRSESSKANVSKAREKVKEYLSMSKAVMDEDTDEEYIEIAVKKKEKKPIKYMDTVKKEVLSGSSALEPKVAHIHGNGGSGDPVPPIIVVPPAKAVAQPKKTNSFLKF